MIPISKAQVSSYVVFGKKDGKPVELSDLERGDNSGVVIKGATDNDTLSDDSGDDDDTLSGGGGSATVIDFESGDLLDFKAI